MDNSYRKYGILRLEKNMISLMALTIIINLIMYIYIILLGIWWMKMIVGTWGKVELT